MTIDKEKYPEFAKVSELPKEEKQTIGAFVEWCMMELGTDFESNGTHLNVEGVMCKYYDIDYAEYKKQQEACIQEALESQRQLNGAAQ